MFIVNIFEYKLFKCFFLKLSHAGRFCQGNCWFGMLAMTVKFVFEHTSSIKKGFVRPLIEFIVIISGFVFCFLNDTLADLVNAIDCYKLQ